MRAMGSLPVALMMVGGAVLAEPKTIRSGAANAVTTSVEIVVPTRNNRGRVFCAMWRGEEGYPTKRALAAHEGMDKQLAGMRAEMRFEGVRAGEYAVACFHDENDNNDLDRNFIGIPSEGTGASNDARGFMGPPGYDDARFLVRAQPVQITVPIRY